MRRLRVGPGLEPGRGPGRPGNCGDPLGSLDALCQAVGGIPCQFDAQRRRDVDRRLAHVQFGLRPGTRGDPGRRAKIQAAATPPPIVPREKVPPRVEMARGAVNCESMNLQERETGLEPATSSLQNITLYQLSYSPPVETAGDPCPNFQIYTPLPLARCKRGRFLRTRQRLLGTKG